MRKSLTILFASVATLFGLALYANRVTTYADGRNAHIVPFIETVKTFGFGDTMTIRDLDRDSIPQGTTGRIINGDPARDSAIYLTYASVPSFIRDSTQIDSFFTAWGVTTPAPQIIFVSKDPPPPLPPLVVNDPIFVENFESWTTATWQAMARNPYALVSSTDQFIENSGSAEGSKHLRLFREAKSSAGAGCNNNTVGWEIESDNAANQFGAVGFGEIMNGATEVWVEFRVKFDAAPSTAPWGTLPDPAWSCSSAPDHKLLRMHSRFDFPNAYIAVKDGHEGSQHWTNHPSPTAGDTLMGSGSMGSSNPDWDNEWHTFRIYQKRSSAQGVLDGIGRFTIDRNGSRVLLNNTGSTFTYVPSDELDIWHEPLGWQRMQVGLNRNHWTNHDAQFRLDAFKIWTDTGNGGPGWIGEELNDPLPYPNEPLGMTEMYAFNTNFTDQAGPNNFSFIDHLTQDPFGWRRAGSTNPLNFFAGDPRDIGFPLPPSGSDTVAVGRWPLNFGVGSAPFSYEYNRSWAGQPQRASMYWSVWMYIDPAFTWHPTTTKGFWVSQNQSNNHFVYLSKDSSVYFGMFLQFNDGPPDGLVSSNVRYPGLPLANIPIGRWFRAEWLFVANSGPGVKDGKYRVYFDGIEQKIASVDTVYYFDSADNDRAFSTARWNPTWGGGQNLPVPQEQYILIDDWYVSTSSNRVNP